MRTLLAQTPTSDSPIGGVFGDSLFVVGVIVGALVISQVMPTVLRIVLSRLARRSRSGKTSFWLARIPRIAVETDALAELRREQRIHAASLMFSRIASIAIWLIALLVILAGLDVDVVWALSSAGFLGAAIAIGGQHSVHDYLNGLHILLEDRFGEGDEIEVTMASGVIRTGVVERLGAFSSRLNGGSTTWHMSNRLLAEVSNINQQSKVVDVAITVTVPVGSAAVVRAMKQALTTVSPQTTATSVVLDRLEPMPGTDGDTHDYRVRVRTNAALDTTQHQDLARELAEQLDKPN